MFSNTDCVICLQILNDPHILNCCQQAFCHSCLQGWKQMRNCCPLCIKPIGQEVRNNLMQGSEQFDDGSLALEEEMMEVVSRVKYIQKMVQSKRNVSNNQKAAFSRMNLQYAENQLKLIEQNLQISELALSEGDRVTVSTTLQVITEAILNIESILMGQATIEMGIASESQSEQQYYEQQHRVLSQARQKVRVSKKKINI